MGLISGKRGVYHSDPIFSQFGILKIDDLYKQQLRVHAWKFLRGRLPESQAAMLCKVSDTHSHNTRPARTGLSLSNQDHRAVGFRVPKEWLSLSENLRGLTSLGGFKRKSKNEFVQKYKSFKCDTIGCRACQGM